MKWNALVRQKQFPLGTTWCKCITTVTHSAAPLVPVGCSVAGCAVCHNQRCFHSAGLTWVDAVTFCVKLGFCVCIQEHVHVCTTFVFKPQRILRDQHSPFSPLRKKLFYVCPKLFYFSLVIAIAVYGWIHRWMDQFIPSYFEGRKGQ